ncbi:HEPN domain-containing protein [Brevibacterium samyangense]|uniref:HEPN domain-containing protein n=1 Tax=Brevibacterium samyangense TaxID=366888 RepID=A0ABN2TBH2_9MICO
MTDTIAEMLANRRLERVARNADQAETMITTAEKHLRTARMIAEIEDHAMAFTAAYDGARKSLAAVLALEGLRIRPVGGAHRNTGVAASAFVEDGSLRDFDWMRQIRNATEYPDDTRPEATRQDVEEAISAAEAIIAACARYVLARR